MRRLANLRLRLPLVGAVIISTIQDQSPCATFVDRAVGRKLRPSPPEGHPSSHRVLRKEVGSGVNIQVLIGYRLPSLLVCIAHTWRRTNAEFSDRYMSPEVGMSRSPIFPVMQCMYDLGAQYFR